MKGEILSIETTQYIQELKNTIESQSDIILELEERIDKARKYLNTLKTYPFMEKFYIKDVENILRGDDNE